MVGGVRSEIGSKEKGFVCFLNRHFVFFERKKNVPLIDFGKINSKLIFVSCCKICLDSLK